MFGAPFWKLASFPESESWSGAKSEAKLRKSARYPGGRRIFSRYTRGFPGIPQNTRYFADLADFGPKPASVRLGSEPGKFDGFPGKIERKREGAAEKKGKEKRRGARGKPYTA